MPFKMFKYLFTNLTIKLLHTTKNSSIFLKTYTNSNIEQLDIWSV